jgi:hypothetical protein
LRFLRFRFHNTSIFGTYLANAPERSFCEQDPKKISSSSSSCTTESTNSGVLQQLYSSFNVKLLFRTKNWKTQVLVEKLCKNQTFSCARNYKDPSMLSYKGCNQDQDLLYSSPDQGFLGLKTGKSFVVGKHDGFPSSRTSKHNFFSGGGGGGGPHFPLIKIKQLK